MACGTSGVSMKPKCSVTRQKLAPLSNRSTSARSAGATQGTSRKTTVNTTLVACSTWLCLRLCSSACGTVLASATG